MNRITFPKPKHIDAIKVEYDMASVSIITTPNMFPLVKGIEFKDTIQKKYFPIKRKMDNHIAAYESALLREWNSAKRKLRMLKDALKEMNKMDYNNALTIARIARIPSIYKKQFIETADRYDLNLAILDRIVMNPSLMVNARYDSRKNLMEFNPDYLKQHGMIRIGDAGEVISETAKTFIHEFAHAFWYNSLTEEERMFWQGLATFLTREQLTGDMNQYLVGEKKRFDGSTMYSPYYTIRDEAFVSVYARFNTREDFAECFLYYKVAPKTLERINPKKYEFMEEKVGQRLEKDQITKSFTPIAQDPKKIQQKVEQILDGLKDKMSGRAREAYQRVYNLGKQKGSYYVNKPHSNKLTEEDKAKLRRIVVENDDYMEDMIDEMKEDYRDTFFIVSPMGFVTGAKAYDNIDDFDIAFEEVMDTKEFRLSTYAVTGLSAAIVAGMSAVADQVTGGGYWRTEADDKVCEDCNRLNNQWMSWDEFNTIASDIHPNCRCLELFEPAMAPEGEPLALMVKGGEGSGRYPKGSGDDKSDIDGSGSPSIKVNDIPKDLDIDKSYAHLKDLERINLVLKEHKTEGLYGSDKYVFSIESPKTKDVETKEIEGVVSGRKSDITYDKSIVEVSDSGEIKVVDDRYKTFQEMEGVSRDTNIKDSSTIWRGMSGEEYESLVETGVGGSKGDWNIGEEQKNITMFAESSSMAFHYAGGFAPFEQTPTYEKPSYVIRINRLPDSNPTKQEGEVAVKKYRLEDVREVYQVRLATEKAGELELYRRGDGKYTEGSRNNQSQTYLYRKMTPAEKMSKGGEGSGRYPKGSGGGEKGQKGKYNIKESSQSKAYRTRLGYTEVIEVDAQKLKDAIERRGEPIDWSKERLNSALNREVTDSYPIVTVESNGNPDVSDGGHRIAAAAQMGLNIEVATDPKSASKLERSIEPKAKISESKNPINSYEKAKASAEEKVANLQETAGFYNKEQLDSLNSKIDREFEEDIRRLHNDGVNLPKGLLDRYKLKNKAEKVSKSSKVVAVDYHGTIKVNDMPNQAVVDKMKEMKANGYHIIIYTSGITANPSTLNGIQTWLEERQIPYDEIWQRQGKPDADIYIDDKAVNPNKEDITQLELEKGGVGSGRYPKGSGKQSNDYTEQRRLNFKEDYESTGQKVIRAKLFDEMDRKNMTNPSEMSKEQLDNAFKTHPHINYGDVEALKTLYFNDELAIMSATKGHQGFKEMIGQGKTKGEKAWARAYDIAKEQFLVPEQTEKMVKGGVGSGRYPKGSGKQSEVADKVSQYKDKDGYVRARLEEIHLGDKAIVRGASGGYSKVPNGTEVKIVGVRKDGQYIRYSTLDGKITGEDLKTGFYRHPDEQPKDKIEEFKKEWELAHKRT